MRADPSKWKIGTSSSLFGGLTAKDLEACREAGVECVEVCLFGRWFSGGWRDMESCCGQLAAQGNALGVAFWSVHLPYGEQWDISIPEAGQRKEILKKHIELMEFAACFSPEKAVIHPSFEPVPDGQREERLELCRESIAELSERAFRLGIQLAVECLPRTCLGNTGIEMKRLVNGIERAGICCDTNHLLKERTEDFIGEFGSKIVTIHASDYDRLDEKHWKPGTGVNNWNAIIDALSANDYSGPFMFELGQTNPEKRITPSELAECWRNLLRAYFNA